MKEREKTLFLPPPTSSSKPESEMNCVCIYVCVCVCTACVWYVLEGRRRIEEREVSKLDTTQYD